MSWQSQARIRAAVAERMPPSSRVACPSCSVSGGQRHRDHDLRSLPAAVGQLIAAQGAAGQLDQGVGAALPSGAQVRAMPARRRGRGQRVQGSP